MGEGWKIPVEGAGGSELAAMDNRVEILWKNKEFGMNPFLPGVEEGAPPLLDELWSWDSVTGAAFEEKTRKKTSQKKHPSMY